MRLPSAQLPAAGTAAPPDRLHALDAVRGLALLLGVFLHAALSFMPGEPMWVVGDDDPSPTLAAAVFSVHTFRMTLFFFIAGFFARMSLHRLGTQDFAQDRARRIALPLVVGWVILIPLMVAMTPFLLVASYGPAVLGTPLAKPPEFTPHMFPLVHLWFLYLLLFFYVGALGLRWAMDAVKLGPVLGGLADRVVRPLVTHPLGIVALGLPAAAGLFLIDYPVLWNGVPAPGNGFFPSPISLMVYGLAFGFGWGLQRQGPLVRSLEKRWRLNLAVALVLTAGCLAVVGTTPSAAPMLEGGARAGWTLAYGIVGWAWSFAAIGMALRFMSGFSSRMRYLADASYWIYLVHMPVVMIAQAVVCHMPLPWFIKFPMMMGAVIPLLLASYHLFVRRTLIGEVLNGRRAAPAAPSEKRIKFALKMDNPS